MIRQRLFKDQVLTDRERKNISILELIGKNGPMTKTDISKLTELNIVTVSNYINNYIKAGIIEEKGFDISTGGRKPTLLDLNYSSDYVVGIGLTPQFDEIVAVLLNYGSHIVKKKSLAWDSKDRSGLIIDEMANLIKALIEESEIDEEKVRAIGVSLPGIIDDRGNTVNWSSSVGKMDIALCIPVRTVLERRFRIPIFIERNDVCAVSGERWLNLNSDVQNVIFMYSGIGCGYMISGQIYRGTTGTAGELGVYNEEDHSPLSLGKMSYDLGICENVQERLKSGTESVLNDGETHCLDVIIESAHGGDLVCMEAIQAAGNHFGEKVAFLVNLLNPEVIVIGGGIEKAGPILLDSVRKQVKKYAIEEASNVVKIIPSTLSDNLLPMGAASVVIQELFAQS